MERTSSERRLLAETSSYEQDMAAATAAAASTERTDDNLGGKKRSVGSPSPVQSISETVSPQFQTADGADFGGPRAFGRGRHRDRKPYDITSASPQVATGNLRRATPRLSERLVRSATNGTHPPPPAGSAAGIGNGGEKEYLDAAGLQPYLGIRQILEPPQSSSPGRGIVDKPTRSSFRRMVGRTARRSVASIGPMGLGAGARRPSPSSAAFSETKPRQDHHEELTNDLQSGNVLLHSFGTFFSFDLRNTRARTSIRYTVHGVPSQHNLVYDHLGHPVDGGRGDGTINRQT